MNISIPLTPRNTLAGLLAAASCFLSLGTVTATAAGFETSQHVDFELFREPPREFRQQAWMTYNLSRATEANMTAQIREWAAKDLAAVHSLTQWATPSTKSAAAKGTARQTNPITAKRCFVRRRSWRLGGADSRTAIREERDSVRSKCRTAIVSALYSGKLPYSGITAAGTYSRRISGPKGISRMNVLERSTGSISIS